MATENPHRRIHQIRRAFLYMEAVAALLVLPAAARLSGDLLRRIAGVVLSPRFVFLLGNAIVLLLFRSSGRLLSSSGSSSAAGDVVSDLLDHHVTPVEEKEDNAVAVVSYEEAIIFEESPELQRDMAEEEEEEEEEEVEVEEEEKKSGDDDVEFRRTVEAFIERQLTFRRQESMKIEFSAIADASEVAPLAI